jgi:hypothetical protein
MPIKHKTKRQGQDLEIVSLLADIFIVNIYRICRASISKNHFRLDARLVFDFIFFALTECGFYLLGGIKIFNMGDFRFFWIIGGGVFLIVFFCAYIGFIRRYNIKHKEQAIESRIAQEEKRESETKKLTPLLSKSKDKTILQKVTEQENKTTDGDFKDDPNLPHFSQSELDKILRENPDLRVTEK